MCFPQLLVYIYPLDLAELHSFRLVYFKHKEIFFLVVCIVSSSEVWCITVPVYRLNLT